MPEASRRLRLLVVSDEMEVGGTQRQITRMLLGLDREAFEPTLVYFRERSFFVDQLEAAGIRVVRIDKRRRVDPGFFLRLRGFVARGGFDVVHCFSITAELWGALALASIAPARRPALLSSIRNTYDWEHPLRRRIKAFAARRSWRVVANSQAGASGAAQAMGLEPRRLPVIYNGVESDDATQADVAHLRQTLGIDAGVPVVLFVGRLVEHKDVPTLLRSVARLRERGLCLLLAGDGPLAPALRADIDRLDLGGRVRLLGQRDDTAALMRLSDMVVLPSVSEGLSNVIIEAMMQGLPVIASRVGGNVELVGHDATGLLFEAGDDAGLAACMARLLDDPALRARLGAAAGRRALRDFSVRGMVDAYSSLYRDAAVAGRRGAGRALQPTSSS